MSSISAGSSGAASGRLRVGIVSTLSSLDVRKVSDAASHFILGQVFQTPFQPPLSAPPGTPLVAVPPEPILVTGRLRAEGSGAAPTVYSAEVRPGIVFSDGTPLTADLVVRSLMKADGFTSAARAEARGNRITFTLRAPNGRFDHFLTQLCCAVVLEKGGKYYGTGPYVLPEDLAMDTLRKGTPIVLRGNPLCAAPPKIQEIAFIEYGTTGEVLEAIRKGEIDFTNVLNATQAAELRGVPVIPAILEPNSTGMLHFNTTRPALSDARVRKAIALVIDKREIAAITYEKNPLAYIASGITPTFMGRDAHSINCSPREAKELIAKGGLTMPKRLSLLHTWAPRPYMPNPLEAAKVVQAALGTLGIEVTILDVKGSRDRYTQLTRSGDFDLLLAGWIAETPDPTDFFEAVLSSEMIPTAAKMTATSNNVSRWNHPPMDLAIATYRGNPTDANRAAIAKMISEEVPVLPLIHGRAVTVYARRVRGFVPSALGRQPLASLELSG